MMLRRLFAMFVFSAAATTHFPGVAVAAETGTRVSTSEGAYTNVMAQELKKMLEPKDFFFVNVHIPYEGEIAQTDAFMPFDQVEKQIHLLPAKKDAKVVPYSMSDRMSTIAARTLVRLGYTNVWNLVGGMVDWRQRGYPLRDAQQK
jgi:rhodanese-related sulfurtransferase